MIWWLFLTLIFPSIAFYFLHFLPILCCFGFVDSLVNKGIILECFFTQTTHNALDSAWCQWKLFLLLHCATPSLLKWKMWQNYFCLLTLCPKSNIFINYSIKMFFSWTSKSGQFKGDWKRKLSILPSKLSSYQKEMSDENKVTKTFSAMKLILKEDSLK